MAANSEKSQNKVAPPLPAATVAPPLPSAAVAPPLPAAAVAPPLPSAAVAPPLPATAVAPPLPSAAVAPPLPSAAVAPPLPAAAVAPPLPATAVAPPLPATAVAPPRPPPTQPRKSPDTIIKSYKVCRVMRDNTNKINSLNFSDDGTLLLSSNADEQIILYNCEEGIQKRVIYSKKYGVSLIKFTHHKTTAIQTSTKRDHFLRHLSLSDSTYLQYFMGHTETVTSVSLSPIDDTFITGSNDKTVRIWDMRQNIRAHKLQITGLNPQIAHDPEGYAFAVGCGSESIKLYDTRKFENGPFASFRCPGERNCEWTGMEFSPDGKYIAVYTNSSIIQLFDAFDGTCFRTFEDVINNEGLALEATFSPDSQYLLCGSSHGQIHVWNIVHGYKVCVLRGDHPAPVQIVKFNPKKHMIASACSIPTIPL